jgi:Predicted transcriptional regulators
MELTLLIEKLTLFGLTRQEANIYITLFTEGALTGYEVSKITGISRSNVYSSLAGLVEKGASYVSEGVSAKYIVVDVNEFCENRIRTLQKEKKVISDNLPRKKEIADGYITIAGYQNIMDKTINMIQQSERRIYLSIFSGVLDLILPYILECIAKEIKVVLITDKEVEIPKALIYYYEIKDRQIQLITDSKYVLTGEIDETCLYSGQRNFVNVFKQSLSNTIKLIELTRGDKK